MNCIKLQQKYYVQIWVGHDMDLDFIESILIECIIIHVYNRGFFASKIECKCKYKM